MLISSNFFTLCQSSMCKQRIFGPPHLLSALSGLPHISDYPSYATLLEFTPSKAVTSHY